MLLLLPLLAASTLQDDTASQWTGWMYLETGDVPFRVSLDREGAEVVAVIDLPVPGQYGVRLGSADETDGRLLVRHPNRDEPTIRIDLERGEDGVLRGPVDWMGDSGRALLHAACVAVEPIEEGFAASIEGVWGEPGLGALAVRRRPWGEPIVIDLSDGSERTLFQAEGGPRFAGPGLYVASSIERTFELDGDALRVCEADGRERRLTRRPLDRHDVEVTNEGATLRGVLTIPAGDVRWCAVVAGGSDWTAGAGLEGWAYGLAALGVATLTYDKRGFGDSTGDREVPFRTTASDLVALAGAARAEDVLEGVEVGYLGISRGGWYGAIAAKTDPRAAFFLDLVGPAVSPIEQETNARLGRLTTSGPEELDLARRYLDAQWTFARSKEKGPRYLTLREQVAERGWLDVLRGPASLEPEEWQWLRWNGDFDPRSALRAFEGPVLCLYGSRDASVSSQVNGPLMRDTLRNPASRVVTFEGCDHGLRPCVTEQGLDPHETAGRHADLWRTIADWLRAIEP